jgi:hypothetical protein
VTLLLPDTSAGTPVSRPRTHQLAPWSDGALIVLLSGWTLAGVSLVVGWYGSSGTGVVPDQIPWLDIAIAGAVTSGVANMLWLTAGRRAVGERRMDLVSFGTATPVRPLRTAPVSGTTTQTSVLTNVRVPGQGSAHLPECPLIVGKVVEPVTPGAGVPCRMCLP